MWLPRKPPPDWNVQALRAGWLETGAETRPGGRNSIASQGSQPTSNRTATWRQTGSRTGGDQRTAVDSGKPGDRWTLECQTTRGGPRNRRGGARSQRGWRARRRRGHRAGVARIGGFGQHAPGGRPSAGGPQGGRFSACFAGIRRQPRRRWRNLRVHVLSRHGDARPERNPRHDR